MKEGWARTSSIMSPSFSKSTGNIVSSIPSASRPLASGDCPPWPESGEQRKGVSDIRRVLCHAEDTSEHTGRACPGTRYQGRELTVEEQRIIFLGTLSKPHACLKDRFPSGKFVVFVVIRHQHDIGWMKVVFICTEKISLDTSVDEKWWHVLISQSRMARASFAHPLSESRCPT